MAATKSHRYLVAADRLTTADLSDRPDLELDEADVWATNDKVGRAEPKKPAFSHRLLRTPGRKVAGAGADADRRPFGPRSLPVSVPDWPKIPCRPRAGEWAGGYEVDDWVDDGNDKIPPHEYLARTRVASMSVHEGIGRTLKGRDLSRVRNAIWKKTGFED